MNELDNQIMSTKALKFKSKQTRTRSQEPCHHLIINAKIIEIKQNIQKHWATALLNCQDNQQTEDYSKPMTGSK